MVGDDGEDGDGPQPLDVGALPTLFPARVPPLCAPWPSASSLRLGHIFTDGAPALERARRAPAQPLQRPISLVARAASRSASRAMITFRLS